MWDSHRDPTRLDRLAAIVVLTAFGVTWPVLELLANNATFFISRRTTGVETLALAVILVVIIPLLLALPGTLPGRVGLWASAVLVTLGAASLALLVLRRLPIHWSLALSAAVVIGILTTWAYWRVPPLRQVGRYLTIAPVVMLAFFTYATPAGAVIRDSGSDIGTAVDVGNPVPIVILILDEFPVASIIDPGGELRRAQYPNLAKLAGDGIWFPNAITVHQQTEHSVPAIMSGTIPDRSLTPYSGQYPNTLYTALQGTYDFHVHEAITHLCPATLCEEVTSATTPMARDVAVVAGHLLLPAPLTQGLPAIESSWGDFEAAMGFEATSEFLEEMDERINSIDSFVADIENSDAERPGLFYLHALLPHHPWEYLPDGTSYPLLGVKTPGFSKGGWIDDDFLAAQGMQRHLLQVGFSDQVVGRVITALEDVGLYEEALIILVADHGVSIKPGVPHQRKITSETIGEIAAIPLFVKPPGSMGGIIDERRAHTTDILPTIAEVVDAQFPWKIEGASLLDEPPLRSESTTIGPERTVTYGTSGEEKLETSRWIEDWFPGGDLWALRPKSSPDLMGESIAPADLPAADGLRARLIEPRLFESVDRSSGRLPLRVAGELEGAGEGHEILAVSVNETVAALTRSYTTADGSGFMAMIPPGFLADGPNEIEIIQIGSDGSLTLVDLG